MKKSFRTPLILTIFASMFSLNLMAVTPPSPEILLGMSTALSGPTSDLGINMSIGVKAGIQRINRQGGIQGKKLRLIVRDDAYEPTQTAKNMRELVDDEKVLMIIGNVGTPTAIAAIPIANETKTLLFAAYTGAGVLRKPIVDRYVINYRASYGEETAAMVDNLINVAGLKPQEIAFFTQQDGYGDAGFNGGIKALKKHGLKNISSIAHGRYKRNTQAVEGALASIILHESQPKAVIMVGAYKPSAKFIILAKENGLDVIFLNVSFVGSTSLLSALDGNEENVIITQVVPHPENTTLALVADYQADLLRFDKEAQFTFGSLEGYIATRILYKALLKENKPLNKESVIDLIEQLNDFDIGLGVRLYLSSKQHQASHSIWPTILHDGKIMPFEWASLKDL